MTVKIASWPDDLPACRKGLGIFFRALIITGIAISTSMCGHNQNEWTDNVKPASAHYSNYGPSGSNWVHNRHIRS